MGTLLVPAIVALAAGPPAALRAEGPAPQPPGKVSFAVLSAPRVVGAGSCSAASCHGASDPSPSYRSSHSIWIERDPHTEAYATLKSPESRAIAAKLGLLAPPHLAHQCTSCHATTVHPDELAPDHRHSLSDGVSCEACHGPAERWLEPHRSAAWAYFSPDEKERLGFRVTKNLLRRTEVCAECHVGSRASPTGPRHAAVRDVNHDLIAAGHPRLYFEMSAYHELMPRHWDRVASPDAEPAFESRLWAAGQFATAEAALRLLERRAADSLHAEPGDRLAPVWPEFAESSCFACHHSLAGEAFEPRVPVGRPGLFRWGTWHFPLVSRLAGELNPPVAASLESGLKSLSETMGRPRPPNLRAAEEARRLRQPLRLLAEQATRDPHLAARLPGLLARLADEGSRRLRADETSPVAWPVRTDWDVAAQVYLGTVPLYRSLHRTRGVPRGREIATELAAMRDLLRFPPDPHGIVRFDSPIDFHQGRLDDLADHLDRIRRQLDSTR